MDDLTGTAGAPDGGAPESVWDEARSALATADAPAAPEPEPAQPTAAAPSPTTPAQAEDDESDKPVSRRQANAQLREQIRAELQAEVAAQQQQVDDQRAREEAQTSFREMLRGAKEGDYESAKQLAELIESNASANAIHQQARTSVLNEIAQDFQRLPALEGLTMAELHGAPSISELVNRTYAQARATERATWESRYAALEAENAGLKGRLAGRSPSPERANGAPFVPGSSGNGMASFWAEAKAELEAA